MLPWPLLDDTGSDYLQRYRTYLVTEGGDILENYGIVIGFTDPEEGSLHLWNQDKKEVDISFATKDEALAFVTALWQDAQTIIDTAPAGGFVKVN